MAQAETARAADDFEKVGKPKNPFENFVPSDMADIFGRNFGR